MNTCLCCAYVDLPCRVAAGARRCSREHCNLRTGKGISSVLSRELDVVTMYDLTVSRFNFIFLNLLEFTVIFLAYLTLRLKISQTSVHEWGGDAL